MWNFVNKLAESFLFLVFPLVFSRKYYLCGEIQKDRFHAIDCQELREIWDVVEA